MIKYGTKLYRCKHCGIQTTDDPDEFIKKASVTPCVTGLNSRHEMKLITKEDEDVVQTVQKV
jgi:hypothetical protein